MKEIINYAERMHNRIDDVFSDLVLARGTDDAFTSTKAIARMEKLMGK